MSRGKGAVGMSDFDIVQEVIYTPTSRHCCPVCSASADALDALARLRKVVEAARGVVNWVASIPSEDDDEPGAEWVAFEDALAALRSALKEVGE